MLLALIKEAKITRGGVLMMPFFDSCQLLTAYIQVRMQWKACEKTVILLITEAFETGKDGGSRYG